MADYRADMSCEFQRLLTFRCFKPPPGVFVLPLTGAGFYRSTDCGPHDVICFCCHVRLDVRKLGGRPVGELHRRLSSACSFALRLSDMQPLVIVDAGGDRKNRAPEPPVLEEARTKLYYFDDSGIPVLSKDPAKQNDDRVSQMTHAAELRSSLETAPTAVGRFDTKERNNTSSSSVHIPDMNFSYLFPQHDSLLGDDVQTDSVQDGFDPLEYPAPPMSKTEICQSSGVKNRNSGELPPPTWLQPQSTAELGPQAAEGIEPQAAEGKEPAWNSQISDGENGEQDMASAMETRLPKHTQFARSSQRLATFGGWPCSDTHTPESLAGAGFFYTGDSDYVRCFYCGVGLRKWEPQDVPWEEHVRWSPECPFVRNHAAAQSSQDTNDTGLDQMQYQMHSVARETTRNGSVDMASAPSDWSYSEEMEDVGDEATVLQNHGAPMGLTARQQNTFCSPAPSMRCSQRGTGQTQLK
ncbi:baculoviral IAP repeat-containing protein 3-like isoform X2 [Babylonia areolata]|uniref:baculoviral IAP repeat-containing protein 3-like isoform X2 n=1 Tax=Babylonia areolata TaxID=304850 RepID=UPI003FD3F97B